MSVGKSREQTKHQLCLELAARCWYRLSLLTNDLSQALQTAGSLEFDSSECSLSSSVISWWMGEFSRCFTWQLNSRNTSIDQQRFPDLVQSTEANKEPIALFAVRMVCFCTTVGIQAIKCRKFPAAVGALRHRGECYGLNEVNMRHIIIFDKR